MRHSKLGAGSSTIVAGNGTQYMVETPEGVLYHIYGADGVRIRFSKSFNRGKSWTNPTSIYTTQDVTALSVWYDKWSGLSTGLIHIAWQISGTDDTVYRTIDTANNDTLSTQTTIQAGASTAGGGCLSICRSRGGNVYCATMIDAGAEGGFFRLPNANVPNGAWDAARATCFEAATQDQIILVPGFAADNQDMMAFFWDASADEISRKLYDDSANSWAEASIALSMVDVPTLGPHWAAAVDLANSRNLLLAWSAVDALNADLRFWQVTESAITEQGNVVTNSTDDQGGAALALDILTGHLFAFYFGATGGGETWATSLNVYMKKSTDAGANWGAETLLSHAAYPTNGQIKTTPRAYFNRPPIVSHCSDESRNIYYGFLLATPTSPRAVSHGIYGS